MKAAKVAKAEEALTVLQDKLFDAQALIDCLGRALEADGQGALSRAAYAIRTQVQDIAIAFDEVLI